MTKINNLYLHEFHLENSARLTEFAGWEMPVSYGSAVEEHLHARHYATLFDVSHMGEIKVYGNGATDFLDYVLTNSVSDVVVGKAIYSPFCYADGGTVDDLIVYKKSNTDYLLCVNASNIKKDYDHFDIYADRFGCKLENVSSLYGQLAIQGPSSQKILSNVIQQDLSNLKKMSFIEGDFEFGTALISRTGYTGEDGFEIYCAHENLDLWAHAFNEFEPGSEIRWGGLAARDSLRLEAGFPLYGHELSESISPVQAGLSWAIKWNKGDFIGRDSLALEKESGDPGRVFFYDAADRRIPREGAKIFLEESIFGKVLSGGFSPLLKKPIGSAWISSEKVKNITDSSWTAEVRSSRVPITFGKPVLSKMNQVSS